MAVGESRTRAVYFMRKGFVDRDGERVQQQCCTKGVKFGEFSLAYLVERVA
jgi:hypothetical protein